MVKCVLTNGKGGGGVGRGGRFKLSVMGGCLWRREKVGIRRENGRLKNVQGFRVKLPLLKIRKKRKNEGPETPRKSLWSWGELGESQKGKKATNLKSQKPCIILKEFEYATSLWQVTLTPPARLPSFLQVARLPSFLPSSNPPSLSLGYLRNPNEMSITIPTLNDGVTSPNRKLIDYPDLINHRTEMR